MSSAGSDYDVAILGAGAAGLCAAAELSRQGCSVLVLEARERIGGRIYTHHEASLGHPIELGAEFIHGKAPVTRELLQAARMIAVDTAGERLRRAGIRLDTREADFGGARQLMQRASALPEDLSVDEFLRHHADDPTLREAAAGVRMIVEGFDAADPRRASVKAIAAEWSGGSLGGASRPLGGYGMLMDSLAGSLDLQRCQLRLSTRVEQVDWAGPRVRIHARDTSGTLQATARAAIVTLPVSLLQSARGAVRFEPALAVKREALARLALGPVIKVVLQFREAFWELLDKGRFSEVGFLHVPQAPFPTLWTALPFRVPLLTAWMGGPRAERHAAATRAELIEQALDSVRQALAVDAATVSAALVAAHLHDWSSDPQSCGAYGYLTVGGQQAPEELSRPLQGRLYFAGEATSAEGTGTVEAALQTGRSAARALRATLTR